MIVRSGTSMYNWYEPPPLTSVFDPSFSRLFPSKRFFPPRKGDVNYGLLSSKERLSAIRRDLYTFGIANNYQCWGRRVCWKCYTLAHSVTPYALWEARSQVEIATGLKNVETVDTVEKRVGRPPLEYEDQKARLDKWLSMFCCTNARDGNRQLCFRPHISWVYAMLAKEGMSGSYITFLDVWYECVRDVSIPRQGDDLKHCGTCMEIAYLRLQAVRSSNVAQVSLLDEQLQRHIRLNYAERQVLYDFVSNPEWYVASCDGTNPIAMITAILDSDFKRNIPKEYLSFFVVIHRSRLGLPETVFHLLLAGSGKPSGCNDISSLAQEVARVVELPNRPRNLLIQCDGGPSIWNKVLLAYLAHLAAIGPFECIRAMRLLVGHGGERQDGATAPLRNSVRAQAFPRLPPRRPRR